MVSRAARRDCGCADELRRHRSFAYSRRGLRHGRQSFLFTPDDLLPALDPADWEIQVADVRTRPATGHDGQPVILRDSVLRAPALCRMTSSVFGGIAARNTPNAVAVLLEERIAVGDPGCRVVVSLVPPADDAAAFAHHYRAPATLVDDS